MAITKPFSFNGTLKGEVLLANGSRVLFEAPKWEFSYPAVHNSGYCTIKAEECPNQAGIYMDEKQFTQKIREMQNQSIKINVELTEEGKRAVKEAVLSSKDEYGRSPIIDLYQQEELKSKLAHREMLLEDAKKLLELYSEACPWEDDLGASKDHLIGCIDNLKKEPTPKKQDAYSFSDAIDKARKQQGYSVPSVITNGQIIVRCQFAEGSRYILFRDRECIDICRHTDEIVEMHSIDLSKGWYPAGKEDTRHTNALGLLDLISKLNTPKKQEESTALFDVIGKAILQHSGRVFHACNQDERAKATYNVIMNTWDFSIHDGLTGLGYSGSKSHIEDIAQRKKIDLSKGWKMVNVSGVRG